MRAKSLTRANNKALQTKYSTQDNHHKSKCRFKRIWYMKIHNRSKRGGKDKGKWDRKIGWPLPRNSRSPTPDCLHRAVPSHLSPHFPALKPYQTKKAIKPFSRFQIHMEIQWRIQFAKIKIPKTMNNLIRVGIITHRLNWNAASNTCHGIL